MNFNSECECECEWEHVKRVFLGVLKCVSERGHGDSREAGGSEAAGAAGLGDRVECDRREDSHARVAADSQVTLLSLLSFIPAPPGDTIYILICRLVFRRFI